jgi:hypothetical protein|tara:strand:- start:593 stop:913 length:321 start_codon:yes stop_codon:yes gene_type:complete
MNRNILDYLNLAIREINPNATYQAGDVDNINWMDGTTPISKTDIEAKITELQTAYNAKQYQRDRIYPSIGDQLDMLWHSIDEDPTLKSKYFTFYEAIKSVKVKNPK